jgi:hypothetical protein
MNLQQQEEFYQVMTRLKTNSRAASLSTRDARVTEMINGLLVSKPATIKKEPVVIDLQEYARSSKAAATASVQGINKLKEIHDFINRGY